MVSHDHVCWLLRCVLMCFCSYCKYPSNIPKVTLHWEVKIRLTVGWTAGRSGQVSYVGQCVLTWGTRWMAVYSLEPFKWMSGSQRTVICPLATSNVNQTLKTTTGRSRADNRLIQYQIGLMFQGNMISTVQHLMHDWTTTTQ